MSEVDISEVDLDISLPEVVVEDANTIDTLNFDEVKSFIASVDGMEIIGDGIRLWVLMNRLPKISSSVGLGHTQTRVLKYMSQPGNSLLPEVLKGKTASQVKSKTQLEQFETAFIAACESEVHMRLLRVGILVPFRALLSTLEPNAGPANRNTLCHKGMLPITIIFSSNYYIIIIYSCPDGTPVSTS